MKKMLLFAAILSSSLLHSQTTVDIVADKDNTLFQSATGNISGGSGQYLFVGRTGQGSNNLRRGLIHFDLSSLPQNVVISTAQVKLVVNKAKAGSDDLYLNLLSNDWGEGASGTGNRGGGGGAPAATNDATWIHRNFSTVNWTTPGGDFNAISSDTVTVSGNGQFIFDGNQLRSDVQAWIDGTTANNGWLILGAENSPSSAKRIASREDGNINNRPTLTVTYLTTGLQESEFSTNIQLYPIPSKDFLQIQLRKNVFEDEVIINDIKGRSVFDGFLTDQNRINTSNLKPGVYFLNLTTKEGTRVVKKFIKE